VLKDDNVDGGGDATYIKEEIFHFVQNDNMLGVT